MYLGDRNYILGLCCSCIVDAAMWNIVMKGVVEGIAENIGAGNTAAEHDLG